MSLFQRPRRTNTGNAHETLLGCVFVDKVIKDGELVGVSTSRCYSYYFREMLSLCVLDVYSATPAQMWARILGASRFAAKAYSCDCCARALQRDNRPVDLGQLPGQPATINRNLEGAK